jgi:hypothetical protein
MDHCGLPLATRFDLEATADVPWEPPFWDCWKGWATPVLGELPTSQQIECAYKLKAIQEKKK